MSQTDLEMILRDIRACTFCETATPPLPHKARPICIGTSHSKIRIIGQAPGNLVNISGKPFDDPSGVRLREWLGVTETQFYNADLFAITPTGFCFPGYDKAKGDLPPRKECAPLWQDKLDAAMAGVPLTLLVGSYAQKWVLGTDAKRTLTETVKHWQEYGPNTIPLPHPSWRNNGWIRKHDWFADVIKHLQNRVARLIE